MSETKERSVAGAIEVRGDSLHIQVGSEPGEELVCSFSRTNRLPFEGGPYPLPPKHGSFPIHRVRDHTDRLLPALWRKHPNGVFMPMNNDEACYLTLSSRGRYPKAVKIAAGQINCLTGSKFSPVLHDDPQDYLVVGMAPHPNRQVLLGGHHCGPGFVRQFVARARGSGVSVEGQIRGGGEEKYGGIQIFVCLANEPNPELNRFGSTTAGSRVRATGRQIPRIYKRLLSKAARIITRENQKLEVKERRLLKDMRSFSTMSLLSEVRLLATELSHDRQDRQKIVGLKYLLQRSSEKLLSLISNHAMQKIIWEISREFWKTAFAVRRRTNNEEIFRVCKEFHAYLESLEFYSKEEIIAGGLIEEPWEDEEEEELRIAAVLEEVGIVELGGTTTVGGEDGSLLLFEREEGVDDEEEEEGEQVVGAVVAALARELPKQTKPPTTMCLAAGGKMAQRIVPDPKGLPFWNQESSVVADSSSSSSVVWIHLVSARGYFEITGKLHEGSPAVWKEELTSRVAVVNSASQPDVEVASILADDVKSLGEMKGGEKSE